MTTLVSNQIHQARILTLRQMLKLEIKGLRRSGRSAYSILKQELNLKGTKQQVLDQVDLIREEILQRR